MQFRPSSARVEVYNEGLAVYLHDPANAPRILAVNPASILGAGDVEPGQDKALKKIVAEGLLVTYYLRQDDSIVVEVAVGPPLDKAELKALATRGIPLMKPVQTVISLPSGRLRIDTANTFRLGEDARLCAEEYEKAHGKPPAEDDLKAFGLEDKSGEIEVPPGDYVLTLHRVDFDRLEDDEEGFAGPGEFITLTPAAEIERPKRIPPVIEYGTGARVGGLRACKIEDGKFLGRMVGGYACNFVWRHAQSLGLRRGQRLRLRHDGQDHHAVYLGGVEPRANEELCALLYPDRLEGIFQAHPEWFSAAIHEGSITGIPLMWIQPLDKTKYLIAEQMSALEIEPLDEFVLPAPPEGPVPQGACEGGVVRGEVLAAGPGGIELGLGAKTLKALRAGKAAELILTIEGVSAPMIVVPSADHRHRPHHIAGSGRQEDGELFKRVFAYMIDGGDEVFRACVGAARSAELTATLKEYKKGCTFNSRDGYIPKDPEAAAALKLRCLALWREGVGRYAVPGALGALLTRHWDDPAATSLSCRVLAYPGVNLFEGATGKAFELKKLEE